MLFSATSQPGVLPKTGSLNSKTFAPIAVPELEDELLLELEELDELLLELDDELELLEELLDDELLLEELLLELELELELLEELDELSAPR